MGGLGFCPSCGTKLQPGSVSCPACGRALVAATPAGHPATTSASLPPWAMAALRSAVDVGPIVGSVAAGGLLFLPSRSIGTAIGTAILMFLVIGGLRAADPWLKPVWALIAQVPRVARIAAGIALPILFARSRFGPGASGQEISTARSALVISTIIAYVLMRPRDEDRAS